MLEEYHRVAIIGAGPVGLVMAKLLQQAEVNVIIYERDVDEYARIKGGTLDLLKDIGQKVFQRAGLLEEYFNNARPTARRMADAQGNIIQTIEASDNHEIDRNDLRRILLQSLKPGTVAWNSKVDCLWNSYGSFFIHCEDADSEPADLIIVANGLMSYLRYDVINVTAKYTGTVAITGEIFNFETRCPNFKKLCGEDKIIVRTESVFFLSQPKANGELYYYVCFQTPESWYKKNFYNFKNYSPNFEFLSDLLANWSDVFKELLRATDEYNLLPFREVPLDNWQPHKNITFIGDAAHGMPPYAGVGVNTGLLDALYLSENLTNGKFETIQAAIDDYEKKMRDYASQAQQQTAIIEKKLFTFN